MEWPQEVKMMLRQTMEILINCPTSKITREAVVCLEFLYITEDDGLLAVLDLSAGASLGGIENRVLQCTGQLINQYRKTNMVNRAHAKFVQNQQAFAALRAAAASSGPPASANVVPWYAAMLSAGATMTHHQQQQPLQLQSHPGGGLGPLLLGTSLAIPSTFQPSVNFARQNVNQAAAVVITPPSMVAVAASVLASQKQSVTSLSKVPEVAVAASVLALRKQSISSSVNVSEMVAAASVLALQKQPIPSLTKAPQVTAAAIAKAMTIPTPPTPTKDFTAPTSRLRRKRQSSRFSDGSTSSDDKHSSKKRVNHNESSSSAAAAVAAAVAALANNATAGAASLIAESKFQDDVFWPRGLKSTTQANRQLTLTGAAEPKRWTSAEDECLRLAVKEYNSKNWNAIAAKVPGRGAGQCLQRWKNVLDPKVNKRQWTSSEDAALLALLNEPNPPKNWGHVSKQMSGRTAKQCRERYLCHLASKAEATDPWSPGEDANLLEWYQTLGNQFNEIATNMHAIPGANTARTPNAYKLRVKHLQRMQKGDGGSGGAAGAT